MTEHDPAQITITHIQSDKNRGITTSWVRDYNVITMKLQWNYNEITMELQWNYNASTMESQFDCKENTT